MRIEKYGKTRYWTLIDRTGELVCLCVYRKGAEAVMRRLQILDQAQQGQDTSQVKEDLPSNVAGSKRCRTGTQGQRLQRALSTWQEQGRVKAYKISCRWTFP
jgi:hypothetical protein